MPRRRSAPANAAHTPIEAHLNRRLHRLEYAAHNSLLTGNLTGNFKFLAAGATIMPSESRMMRTLVWTQILRSCNYPTTKTITLADNASETRPIEESARLLQWPRKPRDADIGMAADPALLRLPDHKDDHACQHRAGLAHNRIAA